MTSTWKAGWAFAHPDFQKFKAKNVWNLLIFYIVQFIQKYWGLAHPVFTRLYRPWTLLTSIQFSSQILQKYGNYFIRLIIWNVNELKFSLIVIQYFWKTIYDVESLNFYINIHSITPKKRAEKKRCKLVEKDYENRGINSFEKQNILPNFWNRTFFKFFVHWPHNCFVYFGLKYSTQPTAVAAGCRLYFQVFEFVNLYWNWTFKIWLFWINLRL